MQFHSILCLRVSFLFARTRSHDIPNVKHFWPYLKFEEIYACILVLSHIAWCCFYYSIRNSLIALLEALITTVVPSFPPQKSRSPRPTDWKKAEADIDASPSILVAPLNCCSARNSAHVGDLYHWQASSNSSVRLISFRMVVISACSWPSQRSCFSRKFLPLLVNQNFNPRPGSRHVVRPSTVMILVSSTRSSHTCDKSQILTKPPAGIIWSRNQVFPIINSVSCSGRRRGSCANIGIDGASYCTYLCMNSRTWVANVEWMMCWVLPRGLNLFQKTCIKEERHPPALLRQSGTVTSRSHQQCRLLRDGNE